MAKKNRTVNEAAQIKADDFKLINGIKRGIENRLHAADIQTYAQLASLTPKEILSKLGKGKGYSIKRIEEEDWIGQAHELIPKKVSNKPVRKEANKPTIRQHYENFTIEFLLDEKNLARRTHVVHVQSGDADTWAGWKAEQLFDFIARHTGVRLPDTKSAIPAPLKPDLLLPPSTLTDQISNITTETVSISPVEMSQKNPESLPSFAGSQSKTQILASADDLPLKTVLQEMFSTRELTSSTETIHLLEWKICLPDTDQSLRNLPHDQAFEVSLTLDLNPLSLPETSQLDCSATVYAKKLGDRNRQMIGETKKTVSFDQVLLLTTSCAALSEGIYRLEAFVTIRLAGMEVEDRSKLMSFLESGPLQVY